MANNRQVLRRITTARNISKITKAMEMVAASKMKRAQDQALASRPYAQALAQSLRMLGEIVDPSLHPLLSTHETGVPVLVMISTDKGLCGSLNAYLLKNLISWKKRYPNGEVIVVGKRGVLLARLIGTKIHAQFSDIPENVRISDILPITTLIINGFLEGTFSQVQVLYTDFINTLSQKPELRQVLPLSETLDVAEVEQPTEVITSDYIFEPDPASILNSLLPYYVENSVYHAFLEAKASEHSARMVAMKNASENAAELQEELQLLFNKARQQSITNELLDITTATLALA